MMQHGAAVGQYVFFDVNVWEQRPFNNPAAQRANLMSTCVPEEEIRLNGLQPTHSQVQVQQQPQQATHQGMQIPSHGSVQSGSHASGSS